MNAAQLDDLKSCPFCGGEPVLTSFPDSEDSIHWGVKCGVCGALGGEASAQSTPDQEFAITAWNTRAELRALGGGWLPIESAPIDGTEFQVWFDKYGWEPRCRVNDNGMIEVFGRVDYDMDGWETCFHMRATHWMSFPPSPSATVEG